MDNSRANDFHHSGQIGFYQECFKDLTLLTASEERELAIAIALGDRTAKNRLIGANLRLVVKIAREFMGRGLMMDDLTGEGNLGLIRAAEEFEPRFGTRFSTYATYWIKQAIRDALINTTATIRLPAHLITLMTKWGRMERKLCRERGYIPSVDEVASNLVLTKAQQGLIDKGRRAGRLKLEDSFTEEWRSLSSSNSPIPQEMPEDAIMAEEDCHELARRLERLDKRERMILTYRFGLDGIPPITLKEVGKRLGVTREWVRKIEIRALRKMDDEHCGSMAQIRGYPVKKSLAGKRLRPSA